MWWSIAFLLQQSVVVYRISIATNCGGLLHFYCNKVWLSIAFLLQSTGMQVALDHAPMHCTAFHRQLLLHLSYNWPMEKKNSPARCFVQFPIAIFQIFGCKMWPQHARFVFWMSTNIHPSVTASVQKLAESRLRLSFCVFVFSPIFQKTEAPQCSRNKYLAERVSFLTFSVSLCLARSQNQLWHIEWPNSINILHNTFINKLTHSIDPTVLEIFL